jgi:polysaccharide export outer membrane protein
LLALSMTACVTYKRYPYLIPQDQASNKDSISLQTQRQDYLLQPGDIVDIKVASNIESDIEIFNKKFEGAPTVMNSTYASGYFSGYLIAQDGYIDIPLIGKLKSSGLTCDQLNDTLKLKLSEYINFATVTTKLGMFRITILGEVTTPGTREVVNHVNLNIYQAIGLAGDITDVGNKRKVKLIRKVNEEVKVIKLDVSGLSMIQSDYYYLKPNDVIYVQPLRAKLLRSNSANIALTLSALTFIFVLLNYTK